MTLRLMPLQDWTGGDHSKERAQFSAPWSKTVRLLESEVLKLRGRELVVQIDVERAQWRLDGSLRANHKISTPQVRILFDSPDGALVFQAGRYLHWQDNVRAVALTLEALRGVDRWGAAQGGAQYKGYLELEASTGATSEADALALLQRWAGPESIGLTGTPLWRRARANAHPDRHGTAVDFHAVDAAARTLGLLQ